ncbi:YesL family protein [Enterococcus sp. AZ109]|uniref:YesL family protein n=1 Tax=Enterococcus sp. AZ109 TaxID=2774634 RepID=UPI003F2277B9
MASSGIQRLFYVVWTIIKLNLYFLLFSFMGGLVFGIGPAFQTMSDLLTEYGINYQEVTFKNFLAGWKANFKRGNLHFGLFAVLTFVLAYNLYLAAQIQGLLWLIIAFLLFFVLLMVLVLFLYTTLYETSYEISTLNLLKLAFISVFLNFGVFLKVLFGVASILAITWYCKGLIVFAAFSLLVIWSGYATKDNRILVDRKLAVHE